MSDDHPQSVNQSKSIVDGHMAGGNIEVSTTNILPSDAKTPLRIMAEKYQHEVEKDCAQKEFIEETSGKDFALEINGKVEYFEETSINFGKDIYFNYDLFLESFKEKLQNKIDKKYKFSTNIVITFLEPIGLSHDLEIIKIYKN